MLNKFSLCFIAVFLFAPIMAQAVMKNDPKRPVGKVSKDLGVTSNQFVECFSGVSPTPGGDRPESRESSFK